MSVQLVLFAALFSIFFALRTEQARVVAIQRPLVITQERKTPAYYAYQQAQQIVNKKAETNQNLSSTYLSNLSLVETGAKIQTSEMVFTKKDVLAWNNTNSRKVSSIVQTIKNEINNITKESPQNAVYLQGPLAQQIENPTSLSPEKKWATIKGKFELIEGVGVLNHYIELKRIEEGQVREVGHIDLGSGSYSIEIESPRGFLLAQIKDSRGLLVGEDREKLINLQNRGSFLEGPFIRVGQPGSVAVNVNYPDSSNQKTSNTPSAAKVYGGGKISVSLFDNQNTMDDTSTSFGNVSAYTNTIARTFDPAQIYKNITSIRHTSDTSETPVFTTKWFEGAVQYMSDTQKIILTSKKAPAIIGRAMKDGKPLAGVSVQIDTVHGVEPIYLDQFMIPSANLTTTSENGFFMFLGVEPGNYQVVASKLNVVLGAQMFIAEEDSIAFQNILTKTSIENKITRSFDAFSGEPIETDLASALVEEIIETTNGVALINTQAGAAVSEIIVRVRQNMSYLPTRYIFNSAKDYIHIPMIKEEWLANIKNLKRIGEQSGFGTVIGFVESSNYEVFLTDENYNGQDVVFFDQLGNLTNGPIAGGGFILFNVPIGAQEVILQEKENDRIHAQVFNIMDQQVSIAHLRSE